MRLWAPQEMANDALGLLRQAHGVSLDTAIEMEIGRVMFWAMSGDRLGGPYAQTWSNTHWRKRLGKAAAA
jgi:hypothetical protein